MILECGTYFYVVTAVTHHMLCVFIGYKSISITILIVCIIFIRLHIAGEGDMYQNIPDAGVETHF